MNEILGAALRYAKMGIPVLPLWHLRPDNSCGCGRDCGKQAGKHPLTNHGVLDASLDPGVIHQWFDCPPGAPTPNLGGAMGGQIFAIDEDASGALLALGKPIPNGPCSTTGEGRHYFFNPNGYVIPNKVKFAPGLDTRSVNGYVVLPPSRHYSGRTYQWVAGHAPWEVETPALPAELAEPLLRAGKANGAAHDDGERDLFGRLDLEATIAAIQALPRSEGGRWRELMLPLIAAMVGRRWPDEAILIACRRATWVDCYSHTDTDEWVAEEIRRTRAKFDVPEPDEGEDTFTKDDREREAKTQDRLRLVPPSEMDWRGAQLNLVKGILGFGMMALLYGESGSAKTLIALSLALHVALGREWCGHPVKKGFVAYLAPEGAHSVHLRFHAWCRHHGIDPADNSIPFRTIPVRVNLCTSTNDLTAIIANIKASQAELGPCVLVVVDTVSRALAGANENSPEDMGHFVANCDQMREETGATVLGVHHTPHGGENPRGHSSLKNGSEVRLMARKVTTGLFALKLDHLKDGEVGDEIHFEIRSAEVGTNEAGEKVAGGLVIKAGIIATSASGSPHGKLTDRQLRVLQEMQKEASTTRKWQWSTDEFRELCIRSGAVDPDKPENVIRARVSDLKMQLANRRYVTIAGDIVRLVTQT